MEGNIFLDLFQCTCEQAGQIKDNLQMKYIVSVKVALIHIGRSLIYNCEIVLELLKLQKFNLKLHTPQKCKRWQIINSALKY